MQASRGSGIYMRARKNTVKVERRSVRTFTSVIRWPKLVRGIRVLTGDVGMTTGSWQENVTSPVCSFSAKYSSFKYDWELCYSPQCAADKGRLYNVQVPGIVTQREHCPIVCMDKCKWPMGWCCVGGANISSHNRDSVPFLNLTPQEGDTPHVLNKPPAVATNQILDAIFFHFPHNHRKLRLK